MQSIALKSHKNKDWVFLLLFFSPILGLAFLCYLYMGFSLLFSRVKNIKGKSRSILLFCILFFVFYKYIQIGNFTYWFALVRFFFGWALVFVYFRKFPVNISVNSVIMAFSIEVIVEFLLINTILPTSFLFNYPKIDGIGNIGPFIRVYSIGSNSSISGTILCMLLAYRESLNKRACDVKDIRVDILSTICIIMFASGTTFYLFLIYLFYRFNFFKIRYLILGIVMMYVLFLVVSRMSISDGGILSHMSYDYLEFLWNYKGMQIEDNLYEYKNMSKLFGYDYNGEIEPLTWGDFAILEYYISFGLVGIVSLVAIICVNINKINFMPIFLGILGSIHYGGIFSLPGQMIFVLSLLLNKKYINGVHNKNVRTRLHSKYSN